VSSVLKDETLLKSLVGFSEYARRKGLKFSSSELIDGMGACTALVPMSLWELRDILQPCIVKNVNSIELYRRVFYEYFLKDERIASSFAVLKSMEMEAAEKSRQKRKSTLPDLPVNSAKMLPETPSETSSKWKESIIQKKGIPESFKLFLKGEKYLAAAALLREPLTDSDKKALVLSLSEMAGEITKGDLPELAETIRKYARLASLVEKTRSARQEEPPRVRVSHTDYHSWSSTAQWVPDVPPEILNTRLEKLNKNQLNQLIAEIEKAAAALKPHLARNPGASRRKLSLDYRKTMRRSLSTFGEPFHLVTSAKRRRIRRIVTVCDVSGSVKNVTGLLLAFLYGLHQAFEGRARHFIFVSEIDEVTPHFSSLSYDECFDRIMRASAVDYYGRSDYGKALSLLWERYRSAFDHETVVFFLGDARTNTFKPRPDILADICSAVRESVFLNPEESTEWYTGDSAVRHYGNIVRMIEISRFSHLLDFLRKLPGMVVAA